MINKQQIDIINFLDRKRPFELRDSSWIFTGDDVKYGAIKSLNDLSNHLQSYIEAELNTAENQTQD